MNRLEALQAYQMANNEFIEKHGDWFDEQKTIDKYKTMQKNFFENLPYEIKKDPVFYLQIFNLLKDNTLKSYDENDVEYCDLLNFLMDFALMSADAMVLNDKPLILSAMKMNPGAYKYVSQQMIDSDTEVENTWNAAKRDVRIKNDYHIIFGYEVKKIGRFDLAKVIVETAANKAEAE